MTYILYNPRAAASADTAKEAAAAFSAEEPAIRDLTAVDPESFFGALTERDKVILCGGDGTINHLINDLHGACPAVPIHLWRSGTGNDFIRDVTTDADKGARTVLLNDHIRDLPHADIDGKRYWFLNGCCGGVDALVCQRMNEERDRKPSYVTTAIRCFFRDFRTTTARITVDGETRVYDRVWMAGAMNGRYQGGGMLFAPGQDRHGDTLCAFVWHGTGALGTLAHFPFIMNGSHVRFTKYCDMIRGRSVTIELGDPNYVQMDGETVPNVTRFTVEK